MSRLPCSQGGGADDDLRETIPWDSYRNSDCNHLFIAEIGMKKTA